MKTKFEMPGGSIGARVWLRTFAARDREKFLAGEKCIPLRSTGWIKNLVLDQGLNLLAGGGGYGNCFTNLTVGSGTNPNEFNASGAAIFTQSGNTITASSPFFTTAMINGIFKYGATGIGTGAEQYIVAVAAGGLTCTVSGPGMTVGTATAGAVWMVQQTALQTPISGGSSTTYVSGLNSSAFSGTAATFLRTFQFATPGSTWSVNEVGYGAGGAIVGRIVLPSTVTVTTSEFLVCQCELVVTQTPNTPSAVANVGTGINTAGTAMQQVWDCRAVNGAGNTAIVNINNSASSSAITCDGQPGTMTFSTASGDNTPNSSIQNSIQPNFVGPGYTFSSSSSVISNSGQPVGVGVMAPQAFSTTTVGDTLYAICFGCAGAGPNTVGYILTLTTPFVLPNGIFSGTWFQQWTFTRQLIN